MVQTGRGQLRTSGEALPLFFMNWHLGKVTGGRNSQFLLRKDWSKGCMQWTAMFHHAKRSFMNPFLTFPNFFSFSFCLKDLYLHNDNFNCNWCLNKWEGHLDSFKRKKNVKKGEERVHERSASLTSGLLCLLFFLILSSKLMRRWKDPLKSNTGLFIP